MEDLRFSLKSHESDVALKSRGVWESGVKSRLEDSEVSGQEAARRARSEESTRYSLGLLTPD